MVAQKKIQHHSSGKSTDKFDLDRKRAVSISKIIKSIVGGLIGVVLTSLFGLVVFAFVIKAFVTSDEMAHQLLNSAITIVGTTLGAVLGYFLGRNTNAN